MLDLLAVGRPSTRPAYRAATTAIDRYMLRRTSAANFPTAAAVVDRRDRETGTGPFFDAYRIQCSKPVLVLFLKCISQVKYHFPLQCQYCAERGGGANFPPTTVVCSHSFPFLSRFFPLLSHLCSPFYQTIPFLTY